MRRPPSRSQVLYSILTGVSLLLFLLPETQVAALRGRALSMLSPALKAFSRPRNSTAPVPASLNVVVPAQSDTQAAPTPAPAMPPWVAAELDRLTAENIQLHDLLNHLKSGQHDKPLPAGVGASVILRKILWQEPLLGLDRGDTDGVKMHAGVLYRGAVAGRIVAVGPHGSSMALLTHRGISIAARLVDCRAEGILQGSKDDSARDRLCRFSIVGTVLKAKVGEQVVTSGYDGAFPPGLWLGTVVSIKKSSDVQWELAVKPACDESFIETVHILTVGGPEVPWPAMPERRKRQ